MIDSRLQAVADFVEEKNFVADIGTDHGYLPIELVKNKKVSKVIAADKNFGPVIAAKKNISNAGLEKIIEVRHGDGLKVLKIGEVDTICIAGIGGTLIIKILEESPEIFKSVENLILQPMNAADKLRNFLQKNSWNIADENLAEEGKIIYEIIFATKNPEKICRPTKKDNSPLLKKFFTQKIKKLRRVLEEMKKSPSATSTKKFFEIQNKITSLEKNL